MQSKRLLIIILVSAITCSVTFSQERVLYKQVDSTRLFMEVYSPGHLKASKKYPAMVFFYGGGWIGGTTNQFKTHAEYFSQRGIVCFLVEYRTQNKHKTTPFESLKDSKSAMRFVRENAKRFHIDPSKIIASGGSAGGHLAAATAIINDYNESSDNLSVSCIPEALVLYNPVVDNGPDGYGYERIGDAYRKFSPLHNITEGAPPTIFFLGTSDKLIPVKTAEKFKRKMEEVGSRCDLELYEGQGHGFFNHRNFEYYKNTVSAADEFLQSLGYLKKQPVIEIK